MRHSSFVQWLARLLLGLGVAAVSAEVGLIFWRTSWEVAVACAVLAVGGLAFAGRTEWVERRRRFVVRHRTALVLPSPWNVKLDKAMPGGWVAPIAAIRADGMRFVVDIQDWRHAEWRPPGQPAELVDARGRRLRPDPLPALVAGAHAAGAAPVLWVPRAAEHGTLRHPDSPVMVVAGDVRDLKLALQSARRVTANATPRRDTESQLLSGAA